MSRTYIGIALLPLFFATPSTACKNIDRMGNNCVTYAQEIEESRNQIAYIVNYQLGPGCDGKYEARATTTDGRELGNGFTGGKTRLICIYYKNEGRGCRGFKWIGYRCHGPQGSAPSTTDFRKSTGGGSTADLQSRLDSQEQRLRNFQQSLDREGARLQTRIAECNEWASRKKQDCDRRFITTDPAALARCLTAANYVCQTNGDRDPRQEAFLETLLRSSGRPVAPSAESKSAAKEREKLCECKRGSDAVACMNPRMGIWECVKSQVPGVGYECGRERYKVIVRYGDVTGCF